MTALATRPRLVAVLGMLGSEHDGEALAAARMAERIRRDMGASWGDLIGQDAAPAAPAPDPWQATVAACQAQNARLTAWETAFLAVLAGYTHPPSAKQAATLAGIAARVL